jgi:hypothetical protein
MRRPDDPNPDPPGGRAAERQKEFLRRRGFSVPTPGDPARLRREPIRPKRKKAPNEKTEEKAEVAIQRTRAQKKKAARLSKKKPGCGVTPVGETERKCHSSVR